MFKLSWKIFLLGGLLMLGTRSAYTLTVAPTRQPDWSLNLEAHDAIANQTQLLLTRRNSAGQTSFLHAIDATTGKTQWKSDHSIDSLYKVEKETIYASDFGVMSLIDDQRNLMVLDAKTGKTKSKIPINDPNFSEVVGISQGNFILKSYVKRGYEPDHDKISAYTVNKVLWSFETPTNSQVSSNTGIVREGVVILPILVNATNNKRGYQITAVNAATGEKLWHWDTPGEVSTTVLGDTVYSSVYSADRAGLKPGWVKALDLKTGRERWTHSMLGGAAVLTSDREVFLLDRSAKTSTRFVVLDRKSGQVQRQFTLAPDENPGGQLAIANNLIYKNSWERTGNLVPSSAQNNGWVEVFESTNGQMQWRTPRLLHSQIKFLVMGDRLIVLGSSLGPDSKSVVESYTLTPVRPSS